MSQEAARRYCIRLYAQPPGGRAAAIMVGGRGGMSDWPLVSVVTPVYNLAAHIEETVESVLSQDYPHIEYLVMDGGSTDGTLEILRRYEGRLKLFSGPDRGTAEAVNKGFRLSRGEIFAFLNGDDVYLPGAVGAVVDFLREHPVAGGVYGEAEWVSEEGRIVGRYPTRAFMPEKLAEECFICQPACFLRREVFRKAGMLDESLSCAFDYDLWIRVSRIARLEKIDRVLVRVRMRRSSKTLGERRRALAESMGVLKRHYGYVPFAWVYAYTAFLVDRRDQFYERLRPGVFKLLASLLVGMRYNAGRAGRFIGEWAGQWRVEGARRHWGRLRKRADI